MTARSLHMTTDVPFWPGHPENDRLEQRCNQHPKQAWTAGPVAPFALPTLKCLFFEIESAVSYHTEHVP